mmetsp:Transcript_37086/g.56986  ORF Transcript_37086/g.56986 Transcript_37086/m.56986 type:complete len:279 (+) Transcript_37086:275-1111(+)
MDFPDCSLDSCDSCFEISKWSDSGGLHGWDDVLVDHVNQRESFHFNGSSVMVVENIGTSFAFVLAQYSHLFKESNILIIDQRADSLDSRVDAPYSRFSEHLLHSFVVVISVKDHLPVLVKGLLCYIKWRGSCFNLIREFCEFLCGDGVENCVHHGHILRRSHGTELESGSSVWEWRSTVAIFSRYLEWQDFTASKVKCLHGWCVFSRGPILYGFEVRGHVVSKIGGNDSRWGFACTKTEVVSWGRNGHAHQVTVAVYGGDNSCHDNCECTVVSRSLFE